MEVFLMIQFFPTNYLSCFLFPTSDEITSKTKDDKLFQHLSYAYGNNHLRWKTIEDNATRPCIQNTTFHFQNFPMANIATELYPYPVKGGMEDFNYEFTNCLEICVEVSCCKFPLESQLNNDWLDNRYVVLGVSTFKKILIELADTYFV